MIHESDLKDIQLPDLKTLNELTLEKNSVLVARVEKNSGYDFGELQSLKNYLQKIFPNHSIFVWWDDIEFMAIHDKSYNAERMSMVNESTSNYY